METTTAACLLCHANRPAPSTRGFCADCWRDAIVPGAEEAEERGVLSREACIGLFADVYAELRRDALRARGVTVSAAVADRAADPPSRRVLSRSGGTETDLSPDPRRDLQS